MTDNQLAVLLESIALNLENEIHFLQEQLPSELMAFREDSAKTENIPDDTDDGDGIPYFPCTELLWDFAKKLREQAKSLVIPADNNS